MSLVDALSGEVDASRDQLRLLSLRRLRTSPGLTGLAAGAAVILALLLAGFFLPLPYNPTKPDVSAITLPPRAGHWFGTDVNGFDVFSRTIASARHDLPLTLFGTALSLLLGVPLGLLAGSRSTSAGVLMRVLDVFQSFPLVVTSVAIVTLTGNQLRNVVIAIAIINVPRFIRLVRSETLVLRESRFVEAAVVVGCTPARVLFRHVLPNVVGLILAQTSLAAAQAIIVIAALNFLGIGVSPPEPTWGSMIQAGARSIAQGQWWISVFPGLAIFTAVLGFNLIADSLEERFAHGDG